MGASASPPSRQLPGVCNALYHRLTALIVYSRSPLIIAAGTPALVSVFPPESSGGARGWPLTAATTARTSSLYDRVGTTTSLYGG